MAYLVETKELLTRQFLASPLRAGIQMDYAPNPFKRWIWGQTGGLANILNTLLFFSHTRNCP